MVNEWAYRIRDHEQRIVFSEAAIQRFDASRQKSFWQAETGGQLFANLSPQEIRIVQATGPTCGDLRWRFGIRPDRRRQQKEIDQMRAQGLHFVGDWHTHPQRVPQPSGVDIRNIHDCVRKSKHELNAFLLVIVGTVDFPEGLFVALSDGHQLFQLTGEKPE